jgi:hypothetical protein
MQRDFNPCHIAAVRYFGSTANYSFFATDSRIEVELTAVSIRSQTPFTINSSTVSISFAGPNSISATLSGSPGIGCGEFSNVTFAGLEDGSLSAIGAVDGNGIGPEQNTSCGLLLFGNGTVDARSGSSGGAGTGPGRGPYGSTVVGLQILGGQINASGSVGAGIGSGWGNGNQYGYGNSTVFAMTISGGNINASGSSGAGIGSGYGRGYEDTLTRGYGNSTVCAMTISRGTITANGLSGAEIGSGCGSGLARGYGTGRGSGFGALNGNQYLPGYGNSTVFELTISGGTLSASGSSGAGNGSGYGYGLGYTDV